MLNKSNICTYLKKNEKCCKTYFKHGSSLVLHYFIEHGLFACTKCYQTFPNKHELDCHNHPHGADYRESACE